MTTPGILDGASAAGHRRKALNRLQLLIFACVLLGVLRGATVLLHDPLLAYANSCDEMRYSACFDLYPIASARYRRPTTARGRRSRVTCSSRAAPS